uniref:protein-tyrosine-phosphatase n=1 Tax=Poecilia latipinna TaxID=48699 RepID=A0A3B3U3N9_9TELE
TEQQQCSLHNRASILSLSSLRHVFSPETRLSCFLKFAASIFQKQDEGLVLLDLVSSHLGLQEKQLFSLQIRESSTRWLEPEKSFKKQIKGLASPFYLNFRVRFFISDPNSLQHEQTSVRCVITVSDCRLQCPLSAAVVLASYAVQSEMGDHCPSRQPGYLSKCHFIPEQDEDFVSKVEDLHPQHKGLKQSEAELCFLNTARTLELYGVELHAATDTNNTPLMVGLASSGVAMFCNMICSSFFPWGNIIKISYKRRRFVVHLKRKHGETQDCEVSLNLPCPKTCKNLWRSCVDHHSFFSSSRTARSPVCQRVVGGMVWNPVLQRSISSEHLETKSLPSRSPPSTPNWRSPRVRHEIRKPRPSSVELSTDLKDMSEGEDVFYTYRASVGSTEDSIGEEDSPFHNNKDALGDGDLMLICITPDHEGKFGFNVKGGVDQKMPLSISHVKPDSPAGRSEPRLQEGDLVLLINGRDISEHTHDQVVMYIRASRESHSRQLALLIRRKGSGRVMPQLQLSFAALSLTIPPQENKPQSPGQLERVTTLEESMKQLERGIQSGTLSFHFENLYKRKPGLSLSCARQSENQEKNRYRDVLPYDDTRVVLLGKEDYINASHITSGVCLRYIAAQGPLPQTCTHFWQTVWEQQTHTIIMLTTLTERGRTKCHQYWPHPPEVKDYGHLSVKCHSEECNLAYVTRQFTLRHKKLAEEFSVTHLQYVAWPDHGVPDDPSDFLLFISSVRERRKATEPLMVHCSAGIGRTGVLITMETALSLIDAGRPVFPLDIVKTLRDQRAMMVQTTVLRLKTKDSLVKRHCYSMAH